MNAVIDELLQKISALEEELAVQTALVRADLHLRIEEGKIRFDEAVARRHRQMKKNLTQYVLGARPLIALTAPVIYSLNVPLMLLDLCISLYQTVCFPVYRIAKVRRRGYLIFDRRYLPYLNLLEKLNCGYCSYANDLIGYVRDIAAPTEQFWCPIKHARKLAGAHPHYRQFVEYGDVEAYQRELTKLREKNGQARRE